MDELVDPDLVELIDSLLDEREPRGPENSVRLDEALWADVEAAGLTRLTGTGPFGSGATWREAAELYRAAARRGLLIPVAENDVLAGWLAERAGLADTENRRTSGIVDEHGVARGVPWGRAATSVVALRRQDAATWSVVEVDVPALDVREDANVAGEPRDTMVVPDHVIGTPVDADIAHEWMLRGALTRAVQVSGALQGAVEMAIQYTSDRTQFGRRIGAFQAIQHLVATIASETSLAAAAVDSAVRTAADAEEWSDPQVVFDIAVAKSVAASAATVVARGTHQIFGAIGTTAEHSLHTLTLPALAWANEFGTADYWNQRIVDLTAAPGRVGTPWELITRTAG